MTAKEAMQLLRPLATHGTTDFVCVISSVVIPILKLGKTKAGNYRLVSRNLLGDNAGAYYIVAEALDDCGLIEYGTSIRNYWLTPIGEEVLHALESVSSEEMEKIDDELHGDA